MTEPASIQMVLGVVEQLISFVHTSAAKSLETVIEMSAELFSSPFSELVGHIVRLSESFSAFQRHVEEKLDSVFSILHLINS